MSPSTSAELVLVAPSVLMLLIVTRPELLRSDGAPEPVGSDEIYITVFGAFVELSSTVNLKASYVPFTNSNLVSPIQDIVFVVGICIIFN